MLIADFFHPNLSANSTLNIFRYRDDLSLIFHSWGLHELDCLDVGLPLFDVGHCCRSDLKVRELRSWSIQLNKSAAR